MPVDERLTTAAIMVETSLDSQRRLTQSHVMVEYLIENQRRLSNVSIMVEWVEAEVGELSYTVQIM